jgi:predicted ester cyclase
MKKISASILISLIVMLSVSCQNPRKEMEKIKIPNELEEQNILIVKKVFDGLNKKDRQIYELFYSSNYEFYYPSCTSVPLTRDHELEMVEGHWLGVPDLQWKIEDIFARDDLVVVRYLTSGTHQNEWMGMNGTGRSFSSGGIIIFHLKDGKITEAREEFDVAGMMQQLTSQEN